MHAEAWTQVVVGINYASGSYAKAFSLVNPCPRRCHMHRRAAVRQRTVPSIKAVVKTAAEDVSFSDKKVEQGLIFDADAVGNTSVQTARAATQETDVVVIGSGIGGLCCAALLAKYGLKVGFLCATTIPHSPYDY